MKTIIDCAEKYDMLPKGTKVLCAVSGGADSMCLLHWLSANSAQLGIEVFAAHFEHGIRGEESVRDMNFVSEQCKKLGVPLTIERGNVPEYSSQNGIGTEEAARELRYEFLYRTAEKLGCSRIATAHNADDNAETVIFNMVRGSGPAGICGIPPVRGMIVRPLIETTRADIERYLEEKGLGHVEDSTNASDDYSRNMIRHRVMPVLRDINPSFERAVARMGELLKEDMDALDVMAERFTARYSDGESVPAKALSSLEDAVESRVIRKMCACRLSAVHTKDIMKLAEGTGIGYIDVPGARIRRQNGRIYFNDPPVPKIKKKKIEDQ